MNIRREQTDAEPHQCTECGEPAYIGFTGPARCTNWQCSRFDQKIWEEHVMSLPDPGDPDPDIEDDEPTQPKLYSGLDAWLPKMQRQQPVDIDAEIRKAQVDMMNARTSAGWLDACRRIRKLEKLKLEVYAKLYDVEKAIDTVPVPCYNVDNGSEQGH